MCFFKVNEQVKSPLRLKLESWLNKNMRIEMTDGRVLIGIFLCTDRDRNVILGSCAEYLQAESKLMKFLVLNTILHLFCFSIRA